MEKTYLMGLDIGTTGCKAVVFDIKGGICGYGFREYPIICEQPFQAEQDAELVFERLMEVMKEAVEKSGARRIEAIAASVQGDATMPVDRDYRPLHPVLLGMDYRTTRECAFLEEAIGNREAFFENRHAHPSHTIRWLKFCGSRTIPRRSSGRRISLSPMRILWRHGSAASRSWTLPWPPGSMAMDLITQKWSPEILKICGIDPGSLSEIRESGKPCGRLSDELKRFLGLDNNPVLITGGHDQPCGAIGAGVIREGMAVDSSGTAEVFSTVFEQPRLNDEMYQSYYPCYCHAKSGLYFTFALNHIGGILLRWFRDNIAYPEVLGAEKEGADFYEYIQRNMENTPSDILVLPHFNGSGTPVCDVSSKGAIIGLTLKSKRTDIFKGMLDSLTYELKINLEAMKKAGIRIDEVRAVGGGARSPLWMQLKADILEIPITGLQCKESGCLGAAILAAAGSGIYKDVGEAVALMVKTGVTYVPGTQSALYRQKYEVYRDLYPALKGISKRL